MTSPTPALLDLDVTDVAHGGVFIARHEGQVVFVADALPDERVRVRLHEADGGSARRYLRADVVDVLEASPHRREHIWPEADVARAPHLRPGGAEFGHIDLAFQRALKRRVLQDALDRFGGGGLDAPEVAALDDSDGTRWRTRVTLHVDAEGRVGPFAARSHRVVPVASLPLAVSAIDAEAKALPRLEPGRVEIVVDGRGRVFRRHVATAARAGRRSGGRRDAEEATEQVGGRSFQVDSDGFWQVHPRGAQALDGAVRRALAGRVDPERSHLDLYGGVGLFSATLSDLGAQHIVTVEANRRAGQLAVQNLAPRQLTAVTARVDRYLADAVLARAPGAVVLDPPRAGAGRAVVEAVDRLGPEAVVYVACDPVALARDLGTFRERGWRVQATEAFDLFPHTHHFEVVVLLTR